MASEMNQAKMVGGCGGLSGYGGLSGGCGAVRLWLLCGWAGCVVV